VFHFNFCYGFDNDAGKNVVDTSLDEVTRLKGPVEENKVGFVCNSVFTGKQIRYAYLAIL
jgi:hypothetical protein